MIGMIITTVLVLAVLGFGVWLGANFGNWVIEKADMEIPEDKKKAIRQTYAILSLGCAIILDIILIIIYILL